MLTDPEVTEEGVELLPAVYVIIVLQHGEEEALAETARTDEEKEADSLLHFSDIPCFVNIVVTHEFKHQKNKGAFTSDLALEKLVYLAYRNIRKK